MSQRVLIQGTRRIKRTSDVHYTLIICMLNYVCNRLLHNNDCVDPLWSPIVAIIPLQSPDVAWAVADRPGPGLSVRERMSLWFPCS